MRPAPPSRGGVWCDTSAAKQNHFWTDGTTVYITNRVVPAVELSLTRDTNQRVCDITTPDNIRPADSFVLLGANWPVDFSSEHAECHYLLIHPRTTAVNGTQTWGEGFGLSNSHTCCHRHSLCLSDKYEDFDLFHRLTQIEKEWPGAAILMFKNGKIPKVHVTHFQFKSSRACTLPKKRDHIHSVHMGGASKFTRAHGSIPACMAPKSHAKFLVNSE